MPGAKVPTVWATVERGPFSWRHHYVPRFYLKGWCAPDGKLWQYRWTQRGLDERRVTPKQTGFEEHLYSTQATTPFWPERKPDAVETTFLQRLDGKAAPVYLKLCATKSPAGLTDDERTDWAIFLNSLLERTPRKLQQGDTKALEVAQKITAEAMEKIVDVAAKERFAETVASVDPAALSRNMMREHMCREIMDDQVLKYFKTFEWKVVMLTDLPPLITTDQPLLTNCGQQRSDGIHMMSLALTPNTIFVMHHDGREMDDDFLKTIGLYHSLMLLDAGCTYVYSDSEIVDNEGVKLRKAVETVLTPSNETLTT